MSNGEIIGHEVVERCPGRRLARSRRGGDSRFRVFGDVDAIMNRVEAL